ncbi:Sulfatase [Planctomycetes bacterium Pan216]|uniref:Sulfatase n=1 Tax=Kolteria novifilia TaxID=2527975 RepID=A0A518AZG8_9BACT|nr:Sulfatase [Planctomycetes bacterium Pan216]
MLRRLAVIVLFFGVSGWAHAADRPNILLAISDDQSYPHASAYGDPVVKTPAFDRVAREGVLFTTCIAPSPGCSPSRAALLTGRYPWQIEHAGTHASSFPTKYVVFPELLESSGYFVGYTGKGWGPGNFKVSGRDRNPAGPAFNQKRSKPARKGISSVDYASNFDAFLRKRDKNQPFFFWYGCQEPHRAYEKGAGISEGKDPAKVRVPGFLPDRPEVRSDILDYYVEIEWFDQHLQRMLDALDKAGELDNTLVIVTSDNGMPFPRAKANVYEYGIHMPLAIAWKDKIPAGRTIDDPVSFVDITATILAAADVGPPKKFPMVGKSLLPMLESHKEGTVEPDREVVFSGRERHSSSRYDNLGYSQRALRSKDYLYIRNFTPERWPAGDPQKYEKDGKLGPVDGGYHDIDACPTFTFMKEHRNDPEIARYFELAVAKRPPEELFDIRTDPECLHNLAGNPADAATLKKLRQQMTDYLTKNDDPRVGPNGDIFETYKRYSPIRTFPGPEGKE